MNEAEIKTELIEKIEHADLRQLIELQFLVSDYFNEQETEDWESLSEYQKEKINTSLAQGDAGLVIPAREVIKKARENMG